ncbi:efflux transporter outer membrane subunit [uncultured Desulfuromusa sp.]|uniref:efflux transporter outer membrane subunit n=1 Tax=uncultured Desulfuromusa sp. TaxID=219183 RepID=UPI002AA82F2D|nr:efflux transporter outer membrane subunit [uncultured Desulfuromusa sp.]
MRFFLLFLLLLTACNPLRPSSLKLPALPQTYATEQTGTMTQLSEHWWEDFNDPQLNQLQQQLFSNNLNLRQALYRLQQLEALRKISGASLSPQLNLSGSLSRDQSPSITGDTRSTSRLYSLAASYEIDLWNKLRDTNKAAELRLQAGESDVQALLLSLSAQLTEQYFLAVEQQAQLQLLRQQSVLKADFLQTVTERYRAGLATATDVYQAQQNLAVIQTQIPDRQTALIQAENSIALLLGQLPGSVAITRVELPQLNNVVDIGLPADLLARRPDVTETFLQLQAADHELAAALAEKLPTISISATLGRSATHLASGDVEGTFWNLLLGAAQPLIDGGRRQAATEQQKAVRAEKLATYQHTLLTAFQEVESSLVAEKNSIVKATRLEHQRWINQKNLQLTQDNYLYGLTESRDLLLIQMTQLEILGQQLSHRQQQISQRITLARALGGSWMAEKVKQQQQILKQEQDGTND